MYFGVGQSVLGYANTSINLEVNKSNNLGNITSLNSFYEVRLAKKLIQIHKWAGFARFAKTVRQVQLQLELQGQLMEMKR